MQNARVVRLSRGGWAVGAWLLSAAAMTVVAQDSRPADGPADRSAPAATRPVERSAPPATRSAELGAEPGRWLFDHARLYGAAVTQPTAEHARYLLVWLRAATTVSPDLSEAWLAQYDLLTRLGRAEEALAALTEYVRSKPDDISATLTLLEARYQAAQTVEQRSAICRELLKPEPVRPAEVLSDAHRRLAELEWARADVAAATDEINHALEAYPQNVAAATLRAEIAGKHDDPATRVELLLGELRLNPSSPDTVRRLAAMLDTLGRAREAADWYAVAADLARRLHPEQGEPDDLRVDRARALLAADDCEAALGVARQVTSAGQVFSAALTAIEAARCLGRGDTVEQLIGGLQERIDEWQAKVEERRDAARCARIAWFYVEVRPNPQLAVRFAKLADELAPNRAEIRRVLGWADLAAGDLEGAAEVLRPLAAEDAFAAVGLARVQTAQGDRESALVTLRAAERLLPGGSARVRLLRQLREMGEAPTAPEGGAAVAGVLEAFDRRVLKFGEEAAERIELQIEAESRGVRFGEPIRARVRLRNVGPYAISLGAGRMVNPVVSVSVRDMGYEGASYDNYLTVPLTGRYLLPPGEEIVAEAVLDGGVTRLLFDRQPQRRVDYEFTFVLDPVAGAEGPAQSVLAGVAAQRLRIVRVPVDAKPAAQAALVRRVVEGGVDQRLEAVRELVALIIEREESLRERADYSAVLVDDDKFTQVLRKALSDPAPVVRARALWAWLQLPMPDEVVAGAAPLVSDPSWLVRLAAVEVLASRQGPVFLPVLQRLTEDKNHLVADLADQYRRRLEAALPAPRPAEPPQ